MTGKMSEANVTSLAKGKPKAVVRSARDKIKNSGELAELAGRIRAEGKSIVLAHGVFDLVHMGHVRHLEAARHEADVLIVTVTGDDFVNKGPGRPIFPEMMRAEMLAALEYVDWVAINQAPSAEDILDSIRPEVYVKGSDYENPEDDITEKIETERETVEKHGGRIVYTKDITFSSSSLINSYLDVYDPPLRDFLDDLRQDNGLQRLLDIIDSIKDFRVLIVGDTIIDEYLYVDPLGKPGKENIIATRFKDREMFAGGVIAAANHISSFCREVEVITSLGNEDSQEELIRNSLHKNVTLVPVYRDGVPTTRKTRFVDSSYTRKLFEVYHIDDGPLESSVDARVAELIYERAGTFDLVVVTDFGHGFISGNSVKVLTERSKFLAVNAQTNAGNHGFNLITKYPRADYICLDTPEARLAVAEKDIDLTEIVSDHLPKVIDCDNFIITYGKHGCITHKHGAGETRRVPAFTGNVIDTIGAGDAFFVVTAPLVKAGGNMTDIGFIGNAAGAMMVNVIGHRQSVEKVPLVKFLTAVLK
jgi:rfaE bifunctional protein nucleotidyltransferase chain/domain